MMRCKIYFGEKGCGKTTKLYRSSEQKEKIVYFCGKQPEGTHTYSCLLACEDLSNAFNYLKDLLNAYEEMLLDSAQCIEENEFELLVNAALNSNISALTIVFDIPREQYCYCRNYLQLSRLPLAASAEIIDFKLPDCELEAWIAEYYPMVDSSEYRQILQITNRNFLNIADLMWHKKSLDENGSHISRKVYTNYVKSIVATKFKDLPTELLNTLQQSSVIGMEFQKSILESPDGFNVYEVSQYLQELENMHIFIVSNIEDDDDYFFLSDKIHAAVLDGIVPANKRTWINILIAYFQKQLKGYHAGAYRISIYAKLKKLYSMSGNRKGALFAAVSLLREYAYRNDYENCISLASDIFHGIDTIEYNGLKQFLFVYLLKNYKQAGEYNRLSICINEEKTSLSYQGSALYLEYYQALAWYNIGKVDEAKAIVDKLVGILNTTVINYNEQQPLYSLVFSLAATICHHLHFDDDGINFYRLALNHAYNKLEDKSIYYEILKKCDMYYDYASFQEALQECIAYYKSVQNETMLGEAEFNLGTECMMQEGDTDGMAWQCLTDAERIFGKLPNENFAYAKNNLALYYFMVNNDVNAAMRKLEEALILGLSHFTYMTIYLNLCSFMMYKNEHRSDKFKYYYASFREHVDALKRRKYPTKYEEVYQELLDISIEEKEGNINNVISKCNALRKNVNIDEFFKNIVKQILARCSQKIFDYTMQENKFYYNCLAETRIFLAEFRFWE